MKTSKLLITSLLAAATMSAAPAWAADVSGDVAVSGGNSTAYVMTGDTTFTFTNNPTLTGSISGAYTLTTSGNATLATGFGGTGDTRWTDGNLIVSAGTLQWGQGSETNPATVNQTKALGETISVSSGAALKIHLWTGKDFDTSTDGKVNITSKIILNGTSTLETADGSYYFSGGIQVGDGSTEGTATFRANWNKAIVISSLSGSGTMNFVGANTAYDAPIFSLGGNGDFSGTLNVTSTSLHLTSENAASGATLNIAGGASLYLDATTNNVKGLSGSGSVVAAAAGNTLAIATENGVTNTFSGTVGTSTSAVGLSVSGSGTQTLAGTNYLGDVSVTGGSLSLGGTVSLASSIQNAGTVTLVEGVVFDLTDSLKSSEGVYTLISNSGSGSITNWTTLSAANFTLDGKLLSGRTQITLDAGSVTLSGGAYNLFWKGGDGTWDTTTATNFGKDSVSGDDTKFVAGDNVTFSSSATVAVSGDGIRAGVVSITGTVDAPTTLTLTDQANLTANSIHIGDNATLVLGNLDDSVNVSHKLTGTGTVSVSKTGANKNHNQIINFGTEFAGTVEYSGNLNPTNATFGSAAAKVNFTNVWFWSDDGTATIAQVLNFSGAENKNTKGTVNLTGGMTFSEGASFLVSGGTVNVSGSVTDASITQTGGTLTISLSRDSTIKSLTQTSGTFEIVGASDMSLTFTGTSTIKSLTVKSDWNYSASTGYNRTISVENGASVSVEGDFLLRNQYNNTSTLNIGGNMIVGGDLTLSRDGKGIVNVNNGGTLVASSIGFGQDWGGADKSSEINVESGGTLVAGAMTKVFNHINSSSLNLKGGVLGTTAESLTISVDSLPIVLGTGTTSTINTGKYDTATKTFTATGAAISIANVISGDGALKKAGAGMLTLSNANTYKGGTVIEAGTVVATHANALGTTKGVEVKTDATLKLGTVAVTVAGLSGAGSVGLADGTTSSTLTVDSATDSTFSGRISGDMSVVKTGAGTQEFSGVFTLLGESDNAKSVSVQEGMIKLHLDTGSTPFVGSISVSSGSSLGVVAASNSYFGVAATTDGGYTYDGRISFDVGGKLVVDLNSVVVVDGATEIALKILTSSAISFAGTDVASMTLTDATLGGFVEFIDTDGVFTEFEKSWVYAPDEWNASTLFLTMTIPEPSAFGLLAGAGALALVAARRRRTKKA